MAPALLDPAHKYLRTKCGLPPIRTAVVDDPDDPAQVLLTQEQCAEAAHVPASTVRSWIHRHLLTPVETPDGPRFRESEVLAVEAATRRGPRMQRLIGEAAAGLDAPPLDP